MRVATKPWAPQPGSFPTDTAKCPHCQQEDVRVFATQGVFQSHKRDGDIATGSGPWCSGSGKATP